MTTSKQSPARNPNYNSLPTEVDGFDSLAELALADESGGYVYSATVAAARPSADYTARVMPRCDGVAIPLEDPRILWQR
jgi:hypothetical protein